MAKKLLIIDNYDSFTYNLVQIIEEYGNCGFEVIKNDFVSIEDIHNYSKILFSPGPGIPSESPIMSNIIDKFYKTKSILGVCLGHQAIAEYFGGTIYNMKKVYHGIIQKIKIIDKEDYLFENLPSEIFAGLYHSWAVSKDDLPNCLTVSATSSDDVIMAISHNHFDVKGIQFHPESIMTQYGRQIIFNWLEH
jgi:anthranilate synthase component II